MSCRGLAWPGLFAVGGRDLGAELWGLGHDPMTPYIPLTDLATRWSLLGWSLLGWSLLGWSLLGSIFGWSLLGWILAWSLLGWSLLGLSLPGWSQLGWIFGWSLRGWSLAWSLLAWSPDQRGSFHFLWNGTQTFA